MSDLSRSLVSYVCALTLGLASAVCQSASSDRNVVSTRAELQAHLEAAERFDSPLLYLSEPGREYFLDKLLFTTEGIVPVDHTALRLELNADETQKVLSLFGHEAIAPEDDPGDEARIRVGQSRLLEDYYRYVEEQRSTDWENENRRHPDTRRAFLERLEVAFGSQLAPATLREHTLADLVVLHSAVRHAFFNTREPALLPVSIALVEAMSDKTQGKGIGEYAAETYQQLLTAREFAQAKQFASRHGVRTVGWRAEPLASSVPLATPALLMPDERSGEIVLRAEPVSLDGDVRVVASVSPTCSYSRAAIEYIEADEELAGLLSGRTLWVAHQNSTGHLEPLLEWNRNAGETRMGIVYREQDWPTALNLDSTPVFHIFRNGRLQETVTGWPDDAQGERLKAMLSELVNPE